MLRLGDIQRWSKPPNGLLACAVSFCLFAYPKPLAQFFPNFDVQARGGVSNVFPDHSIDAFMAALDLRVTTLYMGVAVTADKQVVVSRDLTIDSTICFGSKNNIPIYQLSYDELKEIDCGKRSTQLLQQHTISTAKPLLTEVMIASEDHIKNLSHYAVDYCLEMNGSPATDDKEHPAPEEYSNIIYSIVQQYLPLERVVIASSDMRLLRYWHKTYPLVRLAFLVTNGKTFHQNYIDLGFFPSAYCPLYNAVKKEDVAAALKNKVRIIPTAVNQPKQILSMRGEKVNGIVTDRADIASQYKVTLAMPVK